MVEAVPASRSRSWVMLATVVFGVVPAFVLLLVELLGWLRPPQLPEGVRVIASAGAFAFQLGELAAAVGGFIAFVVAGRLRLSTWSAIALLLGVLYALQEGLYPRLVHGQGVFYCFAPVLTGTLHLIYYLRQRQRPNPISSP